MNFSVCIPTYNRTDLLLEALRTPLADKRVSEIIISDDASDIPYYEAVRAFCVKHDKIKLYRNDKNYDCFINKKLAVERATNDFVLILDSDNTIDTQFINILYDQLWLPKRVFQPTFAKPHFDFRKYLGLLVDKHNVHKYVTDSTFTTSLNAMNYFVNREEYLRVWNGSIDPVTSDSIWQNYCWLNAGNSIYFTPGLQYEHRIHEGSHYTNNIKRTPQGMNQAIIKKLKELR